MNDNTTFVGRATELSELKRFLKKRTSSLMVIKGRRRIGKSRLITEFAKRNQLDFLAFSGLAPTKGVASQTQRDVFAQRLGLRAKYEDWADLFDELGERISYGRKLVLLDEISWMGFDDPTFLGKLKNAWDLLFKHNNELILVLCGSVSSWIEKNVLSSTAFLGRVSLTMTLKELPLSDCNAFWDSNNNISAYEKLKVLSVTGGVPRYMEEIDPTVSAEENIRNLCFKDNGVLFGEFEKIFTDLFDKRGELYRRLLEKISDGRFEYDKIYEKLSVDKSGAISDYLGDLEKAGFVSRDYTWHLSSGKQSKLSKYRISDNYVRFYLKYIYPNRNAITRDIYATRTLSSLPGWETIMGLQFENLVLINRALIQKELAIRAEDIVYDNPFFQTKTARRTGCQIDYLIQTRFDTLYVCEIKFRKHRISPNIIDEVKTKISKLKVPRHISIRAVLIHVNGVSDDIIDERYFASIIDFSDLITK